MMSVFGNGAVNMWWSLGMGSPERPVQGCSRVCGWVHILGGWVLCAGKECVFWEALAVL